MKIKAKIDRMVNSGTWILENTRQRRSCLTGTTCKNRLNGADSINLLIYVLPC